MLTIVVHVVAHILTRGSYSLSLRKHLRMSADEIRLTCD